jgi:APA family basic amino acid/polyamine antiporter
VRQDGGARLARVVGVPGAVGLGLGSVLGTGIFVSIGLAAEVAGTGLLPALVLAAAVAALNGLSSAQLAAAFPVSGGTYEYAHRTLHPALGRVAGWMFLCAKTASAATAVLGLSGYALGALGVGSEAAFRGLAVAVALAVTALVAGGLERSSRANAGIVAVTVAVLLLFAGLGAARRAAGAGAAPAGASPGPFGVLHGAALMFVAYTGYGRVATLGEEVRDPARSIPRAIVLTVVASLALYCAVAGVALGAVGAPALAEATRTQAAPLEAAARALELPWLARLLAVAAGTAMLGVLLNLLLGISRVVLAMARRSDLPAPLAAIERRHGSPRNAVLATGIVVAALAGLGSVRATWSFSAVTVLVYYAVTNAAALRLPAAARRFPRWVPVGGLAGCVGLAVWIEPRYWLSGLAVAAVGLAWPVATRALRRPG